MAKRTCTQMRNQSRDQKYNSNYDFEETCYSLEQTTFIQRTITDAARASAQSGLFKESSTTAQMRLKYEKQWKKQPWSYEDISRHAEYLFQELERHGYFALPPVAKIFWLPVALCDYVLCGRVRQIRDLPKGDFNQMVDGTLYDQLKPAFELAPLTISTRRCLLRWLCTPSLDTNLCEYFLLRVPDQENKGQWKVPYTCYTSTFRAAESSLKLILVEHQGFDHEILIEHQGKDDGEGLLQKLQKGIGSILLSSVVVTIREALSKAYEGVKSLLGNTFVRVLVSVVLMIIVWSALGATYYYVFRESEWGMIATLFFKDTVIAKHNLAVALKTVKTSEEKLGVLESFVEHQGKDDVCDSPNILFDIMQTVAIGFGGVIEKGVKATNALSKLGANIRNTENLMTFVVTNFRTFVDTVHEMMFKVPFFETSKQIFEYKTNFEKWVTDLKELKKAKLNAEAANEIVEKYDKLIEFREFVSKPYNKNVVEKLGPMIDFELRHFKELYEDAYKVKFAPKPRQEPVMIEIIGPAGLGKSYFVEMLLKSLSQQLYKTEFKDTDVFAMNLDDAYVNGWRNQRFTVIDEHMSMTDAEKRSVAAKTILKLVNVAPYPLVCASLEEKGKNYFTSDFVVTTSNSEPYPTQLGLKDFQAYYRRRAIVAKLIKREGNDYTFEIYPSKKPSGIPPTRIINGQQLLQLVLDSHAQRTKNFLALQSLAPMKPQKTEIVMNKDGVLDFVDQEESESSSEKSVNIDGSPDSDSDADEDSVDVITFEQWRSYKMPGIGNLPNSFKWDKDQLYSVLTLYFNGLDGVEFKDQTIDASEFELKMNGEKTVIFDACTKRYLRVVDDIKFYSNSYVEIIEQQGLFDRLRSYFRRVVPTPEKQSIMDFPKRLFSDHSDSYTMQGKTWDTKKTLKTYLELYSDRQLLPTEISQFFHHLDVICHKTISSVEVYPFDFDVKTQKPSCFMEFMQLIDVTKDHRSIHLIRLFQGRCPLVQSPFLKAPIEQRVRAMSLLSFEVGDQCSLALFTPAELVANGFPLHSEVDCYTAFDYWQMSWLSRFFAGEAPDFLEMLMSPTFWLSATAVLAGVVGLSIGIWRALSGMGFALKETIDQQSDSKHDNTMQKITYRQRKRALKRLKSKDAKKIEVAVDNVPHQGSINIGMVEKLGRNVDQIDVVYSSGLVASCYVFFGTGTQCAAPRHMFFRPSDPVETIVFKWADSQPVLVKWSEYFDGKRFTSSWKDDIKRDLAFLKVNTGQLFASLTGGAYLSNSLHLKGTDGITRVNFTETGIIYLQEGKGFEPFSGITGTDPDTMTDLVDCYKALGLPGKRGMCGLPYYFNNTGVHGVVAGVHTGGNDSFSIISPVFLSDFVMPAIDHQCLFLGDPVLPNYGIVEQDLGKTVKPLVFEYHADASPPGVRTIGQTNFEFVGPPHTKLRKSIVHGTGTFEELEAPAKLSPFKKQVLNEVGEMQEVTVSPLNVSFRKFVNKGLPPVLPNLDKDKLYSGLFPKNANMTKLRKLTLFEAINGVPALGIPALDMTTSPGVGWVNLGLRRTDLCRWRDGIEGTGWYPLPCFIDQVKRLEKIIGEGGAPACLALGLLKDEKRPIDRVENGNTRLFYAADFAHLVVSRMYLGCLIAVMESDPATTDIAIGLNPHGADWAELYRRLNKKNRKLTSTDIEGWDLNFLIFVVNKFADYLKRRFDIENDFLRGIRAMMISSVQPFVFIGKRVFLMLIMCSGTLATSWLNSIVNSVVTRALFDLEVTSVCAFEFDQMCDLTVTGDDNTCSVDPLVQELWNGKMIAGYRKKWCNWNTTSPDKSPEIKEFDTHEDTVYLKRRFHVIDSYVLPALEKRTIESMCLWYKHGDNPPKEQQLINFRTALIESAYHGQEYFESMKTKLQPFFKQLDSYCDYSYVDLFHAWVIGL